MSDTLKQYYPDEGDSDKNIRSRYVIRTQPTENTLSTVETAALCIAILESRNDVVEVFLKPLDALCQFQLLHGAVGHDSKEHQIKEGSYHKKLSKKHRNKIEQMTVAKNLP